MEKRGQIRIKKVIQVFGKAATEEDVKYVKKKKKKSSRETRLSD